MVILKAPQAQTAALPLTQPAAAGDSTAADDSAAGDDAAAADDGELEDIAQIEIMFWTLNVIPSDVDMVEEAINEITREKS